MSSILHIIGKVLPAEFKIDIRRKFRELKFRNKFIETQKHYSIIEKRIKASTSPLRVAAYVAYDSAFSAYKLFELLFSNTKDYYTKIVIVPDVSRGKQHFITQYNLTKDFFIKKYGTENILDGYNIQTDNFIDFSDSFDLIYVSYPYDQMVNPIHSVSYLSKKNVLPFYISYGCMPDKYGCKLLIPRKEISLFWKVFADNEMSYKDFKKYELIHGKNVILSGYAKMDSLENFKPISSDKKRIIIAPHHTINNKELPLSNFREYSEFFLKLPEMYPQIQFIFRPHPLLFTNMINEGYWTQEDVDNYISRLRELGVIYSVGGDYFDIFVNSDAMIHDCSSFVVEYLYTGKPCCFMAKKNYKKVFSTLGKSCLKNYYMAFNTQQITNFIQDVIIDQNDILKDKRKNYAKEYLALNYPEVSKQILKEITI